jgi:hypothetical protein
MHQLGVELQERLEIHHKDGKNIISKIRQQKGEK